jgi:ABC-type antimicrobial peptide transport system permease subunit
LEDRLGDWGFDATDSLRMLAGLMALQNTYLRTFQSLGALGLLLGTFGLAAVQLRNVLERRGEMGLLRAAGFRRRRLAQLVLLENVLLLLAGLAAGVLAAGLAVLPQLAGGAAAVPWRHLALMLLVILLAGVAAGAWATRLTLRVPVLAALREER